MTAERTPITCWGCQGEYPGRHPLEWEGADVDWRGELVGLWRHWCGAWTVAPNKDPDDEVASPTRHGDFMPL